jgi:hypothetical protein
MILHNLSSIIQAYVFLICLWLPVLLFFIIRKESYKLFVSGVLALSMTYSIVGYSVLYFLARLLFDSIGIPVALLYASPVAILFIMLYANRDKTWSACLQFFSFALGKSAWKAAALMISYFIILSPYLFRNGINAEGGLVTYDLFSTEVMHHLTVVTDLNYNIFPQTIHTVPADRSYYHYFSNLFIHIFSISTGATNNFVLFVYFFVPVMLLTLAVNIYAFTMNLWTKTNIALLAVFISFFCYDMSSLILWIRGIIADKDAWFGSTYPTNLSVWTPIVSQFQLFHNPSYLFSTSLFFGVCLSTILWDKTRTKLFFVLSVLGWVFMIKAKITAFLIGIAGVAAYAFCKSIFSKQHHMTVLAVIVVALAFPFLISSAGTSRNGIEFSNWYFPANFALRSHLITEPIRSQIAEFSYPQSWKGFASFGMAFIIYYAVLINFRWIAAMNRLSLKKLRSLISAPTEHTFTFSMFMAGLGAFILLSNQMRKYDSMWFYLLILFLMNVYAAERIHTIFTRRNKLARFGQIGLALLLLFALGSFLLPVLRPPVSLHHTYSAAEMNGFNLLRETGATGRVLTKYTDLYATGDELNMSIQVFSRTPVVTEGVNYVFAYDERDPDYLEKLANIRNDVSLFYSTSSADSALFIIRQYGVNYVVIKYPDRFKFDPNLIMEPFFREKEISIFKVGKSSSNERY